VVAVILAEMGYSAGRCMRLALARRADRPGSLNDFIARQRSSNVKIRSVILRTRAHGNDSGINDAVTATVGLRGHTDRQMMYRVPD